MTKLEQLIKKFCPNGVEYKKIGDIATDVFRGAGITRDQVTETGTPCVRYGEIYTTYGIYFEACVSHTDENSVVNKKYFEYGDILFAITGESVKDIAKSTAYIGNEKCLAGGDIVVLKHNQNPKYISYALSTVDAQIQKSKGKVKSKVVHSSVPAIKDIVIPLPPLEVQAEIVRILDNFTKLTAELTAELTARKKQYEFYRCKLLSFDDSVNYKTIEEIFEIKNGYTPSKSNKSFWENGELPWFRMEDIRENGRVLSSAKQQITMEAAKNKPFAADSIIVSTSATIGEHALIKVDFLCNQRFTCLTLKKEYKDIFDVTFLYYYCYKLDEFCLSNLNKGNFASVDMSKFCKFKIPLIDISEQKNIVSILNRFDKLCNDISEGLPAEISARQKQYEYYRDKLLTFSEIGAY